MHGQDQSAEFHLRDCLRERVSRVECLSAVDHAGSGWQLSGDFLGRHNGIVVDFDLTRVFPSTILLLVLQCDLVNAPLAIRQEEPTKRGLTGGKPISLALVKREGKALTVLAVDHAIEVGRPHLLEFARGFGKCEQARKLGRKEPWAALAQNDLFALTRFGRPHPLRSAVFDDDFVALVNAQPPALDVPDIGAVRLRCCPSE